jgi:DNA-binding NarL/FixJ family response regulator
MRSAGRLGQFADALPLTVNPADERLPPMWHARLAAWSALILTYAGRVDDGLAAARDAVNLAGESGDPLSIAYARHASAMCGDLPSRPAHIEAALAALTGQDPESLDLRMLLMTNYLAQMIELGRQKEADAALAQALPLGERVGTVRAAFILVNAADLCFRRGRLDEALVHLAGIDSEYLSTDELAPHAGLTAIIALHRGDQATADVHLRRAIGTAPVDFTDTPAPMNPLTQALAMRAEAAGDLERAVTLMATWLSASVGLRRQERHDDLPYLVRLALAAGDTATARTAVDVARADTVVDTSPSRLAAARFCQALVEDDADELLAVAAEYSHDEWPLHAADAFEQAATRLAEAGDTVRARAALTDAVRLYAEAGATWDIQRAEARLRPFGVRRGPRSTHRRATTGWDALTPSEERIARLVAQGKSNPDIAVELFLSRRTVQTHVSNILAKLELRSRIDVVRAAARYPLLTDSRPDSGS